MISTHASRIHEIDYYLGTALALTNHRVITHVYYVAYLFTFFNPEYILSIVNFLMIMFRYEVSHFKRCHAVKENLLLLLLSIVCKAFYRYLLKNIEVRTFRLNKIK